jgi:hypothetical protein
MYSGSVSGTNTGVVMVEKGKWKNESVDDYFHLYFSA